MNILRLNMYIWICCLPVGSEPRWLRSPMDISTQSKVNIIQGANAPEPGGSWMVPKPRLAMMHVQSSLTVCFQTTSQQTHHDGQAAALIEVVQAWMFLLTAKWWEVSVQLEQPFCSQLQHILDFHHPAGCQYLMGPTHRTKHQLDTISLKLQNFKYEPNCIQKTPFWCRFIHVQLERAGA